MTTRTSATGRPAYTLVELIVVLTIIVAMAGMVVPRMAGSIGRQSAGEAAMQLALTFRGARELAVASQRACAVQLDLDAGGYIVTQQGGAGGSGEWQPVGSAWLRPRRWPAGVEVASCRAASGEEATQGQVPVRFLADGRSSGVSVRLAAGEDSYDVVVHPHTGRAVWADSREASFPPDQFDLGDE